MSLPIKNFLFIFTPTILILLVTPQAFAQTNVSTSIINTVNTGTNTVNGQIVQNTSSTKIIINGKEYVNDDSGGSHDIVDDSNGSHVEVHVNSNTTKSTATPTVRQSTITPSLSPLPTKTQAEIEKKKAEVKEKIAAKKEEIKEKKKSILEEVREKLDDMFKQLAGIFSGKPSN